MLWEQFFSFFCCFFCSMGFFVCVFLVWFVCLFVFACLWLFVLLLFKKKIVLWLLLSLRRQIIIDLTCVNSEYCATNRILTTTKRCSSRGFFFPGPECEVFTCASFFRFLSFLVFLVFFSSSSRSVSRQSFSSTLPSAQFAFPEHCRFADLRAAHNTFGWSVVQLLMDLVAQAKFI